MYKIMLADDEGIVIDSLKFIIEKEFGNEFAVEFAKTGRSVIELAETFRPDIAIMDIQMPGINGIEAMKEIRQSNANIVFIVMSAYDKFDYATEAIKLGVLEYITKPMDKTKIVNAIKKAVEVVDKDRKRRSNELMVKEKLETVVPIIENGLIYDIFSKERFTEDIDSYRTVLGIESEYAYMLAVICGDAQEGSHMTNAVGSSVKMQQHYREVREILKEYFDCIVGNVMSNKIAVLVPYDKGSMDYNERIELIDNAREAVRRLKKKIDINFRIGISRPGKFTDMSSAYSEAINALFITTGSVAHADDLPIGVKYEENYPADMEKELWDSVEKGDTNNALIAAGNFFDWMRDNTSNDMEIKTKVLEFVLWAEKIAYVKGGMTYSFNTRQDYLPTLLSLSDYGKLKEWFLEKIKQACHNVLSTPSEKSNSVIETAKEYIRANYNKDISLDDVSRILNISPYYFSKLFKDDTDVNFIEYLTNIRIDKAKELLNSTNYSMKEICSMVGYSDPNYFSRSFKKNVGVTPTEYKEGKVSDEE